MKNTPLKTLSWNWIAAFGLALVSSAVALGHGGGHEPPPPPYDGPKDVVRPGPGNGQGSPPGSKTPRGGAGGPTTPGPTGPGTPGGGPTPRTVIEGAGEDLTGWSLWWRFNQHAFLGLKDAIWAPGVASGDDDSFFLGQGTKPAVPASFRPTGEQLSELVVPALVEVLEKEGQPQVLSGCLTALARIGDVPPASGDRTTEEVIASFLDDPNQQMNETAALCLGILGKRSSLSDLANLVDDGERGRELCGGSQVPVRTRAFAAYGIGILANQSDNRDVRRYAAHRLAHALQEDETGSHDLGVACVNALSLVELPSVPAHWDAEDVDRSPSASREAMLRFFLERFRDRSLKELVRAHLPRAMARLAAAEGDVDEDRAVRSAVADALLKTGGDVRADRTVRQGCVIALGLLGDASESETGREIRRFLEKAVEEGDVMSRHLALIALAETSSRRRPGGSLAAQGEVRALLLKQLAVGKSRSRPWAAIALGVQGYRLRERNVELSEDVRTALRRSLEECRSPEDVGAYAIALGLLGDVGSAPLLQEKLAALGEDGARGQLALALGMIGDRNSIEVLQELLPEAAYRPELLRQASIALALLGDKSLVDSLARRVEETESSARRAVYAWALAEVGDVRAVDPVLAMLTDEELPVLARGIATLAVGFICERGRVPWNTPLAVDVNYPANPESLFSPGGGGILNIR